MVSPAFAWAHWQWYPWAEVYVYRRWFVRGIEMGLVVQVWRFHARLAWTAGPFP